MNDSEFNKLMAKLQKKSNSAHAKLEKLRAEKRYDDEFDRANKDAFIADNEISSLLQKRAREGK